MGRKTRNAFSYFVLSLALLVLIAGALVTSTGSGLAVPDWPLAFGQFFPEMVGGVLFEHGHRLIAGSFAVLVTLQALLYWFFEPRIWLKRLTLVALFLVLCQALLGGLTVILKLPPQVSVSHACLAQLVFCCQGIITLAGSKSWDVMPRHAHRKDWNAPLFSKLCIVMCVFFFFQLLLGATMRHNGAGLAIPDFPLVFGGLYPSHFDFGILIHYLHRVGALILVVMAAGMAYYVQKKYPQHLDLVAGFGALLLLLSTQVMLAAMVIWMKKPVPLTSAHLAVGALCFLTSVLLTGRVLRMRYLLKEHRRNDFSPTVGLGAQTQPI